MELATRLLKRNSLRSIKAIKTYLLKPEAWYNEYRLKYPVFAEYIEEIIKQTVL